jgi:protein-disulfide isomerase-like protein with CxxC motif
VEDKLDTDLNITWKAFLLEQVNSRRGADWKAWQDPRFTSRDMPPHEAAKSILAHHGEEVFKQYHMALFRAYHVDKRDIANPLELIAIAREQGIDTAALAEDLRTRRFKEEIGQDHDEADEKYDIFGVPTVIFNGEQPTFFKLAAGVWEETGEDDVALFNDLCGIAAPRPYVMEIKKPASAASASASAARREREGS